MVKNFNIYKLLQTFYNMTSIRGTVHDTVKRISFVLELEGPMATEVYVWQRDARYQSEPTILSDVPILMMKNTKEASLSNTGDVKECNTGHVVIGNLRMVNIAKFHDGTFFDRNKVIHFEKRIFLEPDLTKPQIITGFLPNGVKKLSPDNNTILAIMKEDIQYPITITEIKHTLQLQIPPNDIEHDNADNQISPSSPSSSSQRMSSKRIPKRNTSQKSASSPSKKRSASAEKNFNTCADLDETLPYDNIHSPVSPNGSINSQSQDSRQDTSNARGQKVMQPQSSTSSADSAIAADTSAHFIENSTERLSQSSSITTHISGSRDNTPIADQQPTGASIPSIVLPMHVSAMKVQEISQTSNILTNDDKEEKKNEKERRRK